MDRHLKAIHQGYRPHQCSMCHKSFSQPTHLREHERTHTGEHPYKCGYCERAFTQPTPLKRHRYTHQGDPLYSDWLDKQEALKKEAEAIQLLSDMQALNASVLEQQERKHHKHEMERLPEEQAKKIEMSNMYYRNFVSIDQDRQKYDDKCDSRNMMSSEEHTDIWQESPHTSNSQDKPNNTVINKKRGRPKGSKNKQTKTSTLKKKKREYSGNTEDQQSVESSRRKKESVFYGDFFTDIDGLENGENSDEDNMICGELDVDSCSGIVLKQEVHGTNTSHIKHDLSENNVHGQMSTVPVHPALTEQHNQSTYSESCQPAKQDIPQTCTMQPAKQDIPQTCTLQPAKQDIPQTCTMPPAKQDIPQTCTMQPAKQDMPQTCTMQPAGQDTVQTDTSQPTRQDTAQTYTIQPIGQDTAQTDTIQPTRQDTAQTDTIQPIRQDTAQTDTIQPIRQDTAQTCTRQPARQESLKHEVTQDSTVKNELPSVEHGWYIIVLQKYIYSY